MSIGDRLVRRRRLVLGVLAGGPTDTATVARRVRGEFYEVYGVLSDLKLAGIVGRTGRLWRLGEHGGDELPREWMNPGHAAYIDPLDARLKRAGKTGGEVGEDRPPAQPSPHLSHVSPAIFPNPERRATSGLAAIFPGLSADSYYRFFPVERRNYLSNCCRPLRRAR